MGFIGNIGQALQRLDRRLSGRPVSAVVTSGSHRLANNQGQQVLISHDQIVQTNPVVFGVWSRLVRTLATTDIIVEQRRDDKRWHRATDTALEALLREPAEGRGLTSTLQWLFNPLCTEGNALVVPVYDDPGRPGLTPSGLVPLDWRYMTAWARTGGPVELWASHQAGDPVPFWPSDVLHLAWDPPTGVGIGISPLASLGTAVRVDDAAGRLLEAQYNNGLHFGGFLRFPADLTDDQMPSDEQIDEMRDQWRATYGSVDGAFAVAVLRGGLEFQQVSMTVKDAEIIRARELASGDVYRAFGQRRSDFEDTEGGDFDQRARSLHRSLLPIAMLAEDMLKRQLCDRHEEWRDMRVRLDLSGLVKGTYREEQETAVHAYTNGLSSLNEARARVGMEPLPDPEANKTFIPHAQLKPGVDGRTNPATDRDLPGRETRQIPTTSG